MAPETNKNFWADFFSCSCFSTPKCEDYQIQKLVVPSKEQVQPYSSSSSSSPRRLSLMDLYSNPGSEISMSDLSNSLVGSNVHSFTLSEIRSMTKNFTSGNLLGGGGFGAVYKGFINDKVKPGLDAQVVAVKVLDLEGSQGHKEWLAEVIFLGQLRHQNLVKLTGYCCENDQRVLVYEYMERGNLDEKLFRRCFAPLPWLTRIKIAIEAAKGLAFLHGEKKPVIFRDFKAANILLASDFTAKLSDFGFARDGPEDDKTHVSTQHRLGTRGYAAPEYIMTGHLTTMSDVYSFGVVLLELLTGRRSIDKTRPRREQNLVEWARPQLKDTKKLDQIMDPRLEGQYSREGVKIAAILAYQCLSYTAKSRPSMSLVVKTLEPVLNMKDDYIMPGPFVYVAPTEQGRSLDSLSNERRKESNKSSTRDVDSKRRSAERKEREHRRKENGTGGGEEHRRKENGTGGGEKHRRRRSSRDRRVSRNRDVHSDSALDVKVRSTGSG